MLTGKVSNIDLLTHKDQTRESWKEKTQARDAGDEFFRELIWRGKQKTADQWNEVKAKDKNRHTGPMAF